MPYVDTNATENVGRIIKAKLADIDRYLISNKYEHVFNQRHYELRSAHVAKILASP